VTASGTGASARFRFNYIAANREQAADRGPLDHRPVGRVSVATTIGLRFMICPNAAA